MSTFFFSRCHRPAVALCLAGLFLSASAQGLARPGAAEPAAELSATSPSLAVAVEAAWRLGAGSRSLASRQAELDARQQAARSWLSGPPSLNLSQRTDRLTTNQGLREYEAGLSMPLWSPGTRAATSAQVDAERAALSTEPQAGQLKLAGELRELAASAALARLEQGLAQRKEQEGTALLQDTQRRVKSGESPRIDALQADAALRLAAVQRVQASTALAQLQSQWRALTGLQAVSLPDESWNPATTSSLENHPLLASAAASVRAAQARLKLAEADTRDAPELSLGVIRDRSLASDPALNSLRIGVRIPFGGNRSAARIAAARAGLDAAQAEFDAIERRLAAELITSRDAVESARLAERLASERAAFSAEAQTLVAKAYRLGESDLPTRLRTDNEGFEADLALARARTETQRAVARLHQSSGLLP